MSMLETLQKSAKERRALKERLWGKPQAQVIHLKNHVETAVQEEPAPVPQPPPAASTRDKLITLQREVRSLRDEMRRLSDNLQIMLGDGDEEDITPRPSIHEIIVTVAKRYGVEPLDMLSHRRTVSVSRPRQVAMYLARAMTLHSLPAIGKKFGDRDHSTIHHCIRNVERWRAHDADLDRDLNDLTAKLTANTRARVTAQAQTHNEEVP